MQTMSAHPDEDLARPYEELPYESNPYFESHPGRLATLAYLSGLEPPPIETCRVLELGCAAGGNLIPAAEALPGASFVGVDIAPNQIADGRALIEALGLRNVRLEAMSVTDLTPDFGSFDYIIAHGLYSWVPADVRRKTLEICKARLSPNGVAYISYNVLPGWRLRGVIRDMLFYGLEKEPASPTPRERVPTARRFAEMILNAAGEDDTTHARILRNEVGMVLKAPDSYIAHDHLEEFHEALYFRDFAARAASNGLMVLGDARFSNAVFQVERRLKQQRPELPADPIHFEQCVDFAFGRQFRRSLLCHAGQSIHRDLLPERLMRCHLLASVFPSGPVDLRPNVSITFQSRDGGSFNEADTGTKAALAFLAQAHPMPVSFDALWDQVRNLARMPRQHPARDRMAEMLRTLVICDSVEPHLYPPQFVTHISARPLATSLARLQASRGGVIHNRRHRTIRSFNDFDRSIIALLDGTRDVTALRAAVAPPGSDPADMEFTLRESLGGIAAASVLIA
jgi:SAM-dependent methyltransferase